MKTRRDKTCLEREQKTIKEKFKAEIIGIFGSYVRGEQRESSDLDVLVKLEENATLFDLVGLAVFLEELLELEVDVIPHDGVREELKEQIFKGVIPA